MCPDETFPLLVETPPQVIAWQPHVAVPVLAEVPEGLERPCSRALIKDGWPDAEPRGRGLVAFAHPVAADRLFPMPRFIYGWRMVLTQATVAPTEAGLVTLLTGVTPVWREWIDLAEGEALPYRFSVSGVKLPRAALPRWLDLCRQKFQPLGLVDRPKAYAAEIVASFADGVGTLYFRPGVADDPRFAYRKGKAGIKDVGASMNPVVAAALARLLPVPLGGIVIDATCGSGTLLIERVLADPGALPAGLDISVTAVKTARANVTAAGLDASRLRQGNAADPALWQPARAVIANLPFGLRTKREDDDLAGLYRAIVANTATYLEPGGRALLATTQLKRLDEAVRASPRLKILARHRVQTGGLWVHIVVLGSN